MATDGLSDPFDEPARAIPGLCGFGVEVWVETDERLGSVPGSWAMAVVRAIGYQIAAGVFGRGHLERYGAISFEVAVDDLGFEGAWPRSFVSPERTVGFLIGVESPGRAAVLPVPAGDVLYAGIRVLDARKLDAGRRGGAGVRAELLAGGCVSRVLSSGRG